MNLDDIHFEMMRMRNHIKKLIEDVGSITTIKVFLGSLVMALIPLFLTIRTEFMETTVKLNKVAIHQEFNSKKIDELQKDFDKKYKINKEVLWSQ